LQFHIYQLHDGGPGSEELEDDISAANHWLLPAGTVLRLPRGGGGQISPRPAGIKFDCQGERGGAGRIFSQIDCYQEGGRVRISPISAGIFTFI
jgi:hypothetical protein